MALPLVAVYLITFCCYGQHLPGARGAIDRHNNTPGTRSAPVQPHLEGWCKSVMRSTSFTLDASQRALVLWAIESKCDYREWPLFAAHIRSTHVHLVVDVDASPEHAMNAFKSYASRALERKNCWARHGSTRYLWSKPRIDAAVHYVLDKQGARMAWYEAPAIGSAIRIPEPRPEGSG